MVKAASEKALPSTARAVRQALVSEGKGFLAREGEGKRSCRDGTGGGGWGGGAEGLQGGVVAQGAGPALSGRGGCAGP